MSTPDDGVAEDHLEPDVRDPEASPEDVAEQVLLVDPDEEPDEPVHVDLEASEWDSIEQARVVRDDEDDRYR